MGSPKETMDWMEATHGGTKKKDDHRFEKQYLTNLHIKFDFDVGKKEIKSHCLFCRATGLFTMIEEDFELFPTVELILRGLAKAKFRNTARIVVDGKTLYDHPEKKSDLRKTIDDIGDFEGKIKNGKNVEITAILADVEKCTAVIKINKVHSKKEHSVDIQMNGKIKSDIYHTFLNYLNEKMGLEEKQ